MVSIRDYHSKKLITNIYLLIFKLIVKIIKFKFKFRKND
jgi:hypothetical protein